MRLLVLLLEVFNNYWFFRKVAPNMIILGFMRMICIALLLIDWMGIFKPTLWSKVFPSWGEMMESLRLILERSIRIIINIFYYNYSLLWFPIYTRISIMLSKSYQKYYTILFLFGGVLVRIAKVAYL